MQVQSETGAVPVILGVMSDLFFSIKIMDEAKRLGMRALFVKDQVRAAGCIASLPRMVVLDLNCTTVDVFAILREMKAADATQQIPVLGFVSHVQTELRQRALAAGCDVVVPRSVFAASLPELLRGQLAQPVETGQSGTRVD